MRIEVVDGLNFPLVLPLIEQYQRFYGVDPNHALNETFFRRFVERHEEGIQFIALEGEREAVGFATLYWHNSTLSAGKACVLNDLYVVSNRRGQGVARALIAHASAYARCRGHRRLEWQTRTENAVAQRLYDRLPASKSLWLNYELPLR